MQKKITNHLRVKKTSMVKSHSLVGNTHELTLEGTERPCLSGKHTISSIQSGRRNGTISAFFFSLFKFKKILSLSSTNFEIFQSF